MKIYKLKGNKIYFPYGTSEWIGETQIDCLKITITAGGGMGGSRWSRFIKNDEITDGLKWYETIDGEEIKINGRYIVEVEKVTIISADFVCTNHNLDLNNELCNITVYTNRNNDYEFISKYKELDEWCYK